jgi:hypothetical protein
MSAPTKLFFDLNNILEGFIYKDACGDCIFSFSHGGEDLVVWKGYAPRLIVVEIDNKYIICAWEESFSRRNVWLTKRRKGGGQEGR